LASDVGDFLEIENSKVGQFIEKYNVPRVGGVLPGEVPLLSFVYGGNLGGNEVISHDV
jgi:hypothetical protein